MAELIVTIQKNAYGEVLVQTLPHSQLAFRNGPNRIRISHGLVVISEQQLISDDHWDVRAGDLIISGHQLGPRYVYGWNRGRDISLPVVDFIKEDLWVVTNMSAQPLFDLFVATTNSVTGTPVRGFYVKTVDRNEVWSSVHRLSWPLYSVRYA